MKERFLYIDNLKGFAILLVFLGHCIQFRMPGYDDNMAFRFIYSFHMPLFLAFIIVSALSHILVILFRKSNFLRPLIGENTIL